MQNENYYIGLDIGTDSVGYAVTETDYSLCKFHGEPMWGTTLFESAQQSVERRASRVARRRLDRRQQRTALLKEIFSVKIAEVDPWFYTRLEESALFREDKTNVADKNAVFNDPDYDDKRYYKEFPTIHHLLHSLMQSQEKHDIRLLYIACAWLLAHRGHFLTDMDVEHVSVEHMFAAAYQELMAFPVEHGYPVLWTCDPAALESALCKRQKCNDKKKTLQKLLNSGKLFKDDAETYFCDRDVLVKMLAGSKTSLAALFQTELYKDLDSIVLGKDIDTFESTLASLSDADAEFLVILQRLMDCVTLTELLGDSKSISEAKIKIYEQHHKDLVGLKRFVKKYCPEKYKEIFNQTGEKLTNYAAYTYHYDTIADWKKEPPKQKVSKEVFSAYLKGIVSKIQPSPEDQEFYSDMLLRLEEQSFLPKQVDSDNRVIPYQLYLHELQKILENASCYLPWLTEIDRDGISPKDKILSIFTFRVPYFVGPLRADGNAHAWIQRKAGKIYPWNFEEKVDLDACETEFIKRMTNQCTYLPSETVLPRNSLLYCKFTVLNEINNIRINGEPITVEQKQRIYENCALKKQKLTKKLIIKYCISNGFMQDGDILDGIDEVLTSSMKSYFDFYSLLDRKILTVEEVEEIITRSTYMEDNTRYQKWLEKRFPKLSAEDLRYVSRKRYKDFGRLSAKFLTGIEGCEKEETTSIQESDEGGTILTYLWNTNCNLMQLLSDEFTFMEQVKTMREAYYQEHPLFLTDRLEEMYISNAVKRPILRTLEIVKEVVHAQGYPPQRIFVEMARGAEEKKRTVSRKEQILELYKKIADEDTAALEKQLEDMGDSADSRLQSENLYLYYLQLGRCLYSGDPITLDKGKFDKDHIYPRQYVKDDSILNNLVLVKTEINETKKAEYPLDPAIQNKMKPYWDMLYKHGLMTDEKYKRLTRTTGFSDQEKYGFINRQLVETRQSTKAVTILLQEMYPDAEIVFVKAGLASDFRHEYGLTKCRCLNDLHHAKDAYLNVVVGNVYHCKFTKHFWVDQPYSLKTKEIFARNVSLYGETIWNKDTSLPFVKKTYAKNAVHLTQYAFRRKGQLFDQQPLKAVKASDALTPRKWGKNGKLPVEKYGGYNKKTASFFILVQYPSKKNATEITILPVDLMIADRFLTDASFAQSYCRSELKRIANKSVPTVSFPLGMRILKINTVFEVDGFQMCLSGKCSGGKQVLLASNASLLLNAEQTAYLKKLESYNEKMQKKMNIALNEKYDGISCENNEKLYAVLLEKMQKTILQKLPGLQVNVIIQGQQRFSTLSVEEQIFCIMQLVLLCKSGRSGTCDLSSIGGVKKSGSVTMSAHISNWKNYYSDVRIVDTSASGLYETRSCNLLELL